MLRVIEQIERALRGGVKSVAYRLVAAF